jgi:imidazolonepropionase-like amidohydrolase
MAIVKSIGEPARCAMALLAVAACGAGRGPEHVAEPALAFVHVAVVDVERGQVVPDRTVIIACGELAAVGASTATAVPARATVVEARGKYLIPGLWDMHVHALYDGRPELMFPMLIANGITSVRDMHTFAADPLGRLRTYRAGVANGTILGPRIIGAGYILDGPGRDGPPEGFHVVRTPDEARREVDTVVAGGADFMSPMRFMRCTPRTPGSEHSNTCSACSRTAPPIEMRS